MKFIEFALAFTILLMPTLARAQKTDIVVLKNGDRITGEIKKLEAGLLEFSTDTMGTVKLEWHFISEIISDKSHAVELRSGARVLGTLQKPTDEEHVLVNTLDGALVVQPENIVSVWPVEAGFLDKMELDLSIGLDYSKATKIASSNTAVDFRLRGDDRLTELNLRSNVTQQSGANDQNRYELRGFHERLLPRQHFRNWFGAIESNNSIGVNLRLSAGAMFGKYLIKTNRKWLALSVGLQATEENPKQEKSETNLEAAGNIRFRYFRFSSPERSLDTTLSVYPGVTDSGRVRTDFRTTFKLEVVKDLFWSMELYGNHDSRPLLLNADKLDYGVITGVGWSY